MSIAATKLIIDPDYDLSTRKVEKDIRSYLEERYTKDTFGKVKKASNANQQARRSVVRNWLATTNIKFIVREAIDTNSSDNLLYAAFTLRCYAMSMTAKAGLDYLWPEIDSELDKRLETWKEIQIARGNEYIALKVLETIGLKKRPRYKESKYHYKVQ